MTVFLTILKIIGVTLLAVLGIVLILLAVVLFVPIRYSSTGKYDSESKPLIEARVTWICHIIRFYFTLNGKEKNYYLKVLWFTLYPKSKPEKTEESSFGEDIEDLDDIEGKNDDKAEKDVESDKDDKTAEALKTDEAFNRLNEAVSEETAEDSKVQALPDKQPQKKEKSEKKSIFRRIKESIDNFKFKFKQICDKISSGRLKIEDIVDKLTDPRTSNAVTLLLLELKKLLYHIRPRKFRLYIRYGFEDPSYTGQLYGFYNSLYGIHLGKPDIVPDFEHSCFEGDYLIKGYVQVIFILIAAIKLYFNKDIKRLIAIIKHR